MCIYTFLKNYTILKNICFKDTTERKMFNINNRIYVLGWEDNIEDSNYPQLVD